MTESTVAPSDIRAAYDRLVEIAKRGRRFRWDDVHYRDESTTDEQAAAIIGTGYDFTRTIPVWDITADKAETTVEGTIEFRVIAKEAPKAGTSSLFLRTRLTWTRHNGVEHKSYAGYDISPEALRILMDKAANPPAELDLPDLETATEEEMNRVLELAGGEIRDAMDKAGDYLAEWIQTPGVDDMLSYLTGDEELAFGEDPHAQTVQKAQEAEPLLLCMLSWLDLGEVETDELPKLLKWVTAQPEIA